MFQTTQTTAAGKAVVVAGDFTGTGSNNPIPFIMRTGIFLQP